MSGGRGARPDEVETLLERVARWARGRADVRAVALVGSWARGAPHSGSDVDLVLLTDAPGDYIDREDWVAELGGERIVRTRPWGAITERRFALTSGVDVDVGVGTPDWAATDPLDAGSRGVAADGLRIVHDPDGLLAALAAAAGSPPSGRR